MIISLSLIKSNLKSLYYKLIAALPKDFQEQVTIYVKNVYSYSIRMINKFKGFYYKKQITKKTKLHIQGNYEQAYANLIYEKGFLNSKLYFIDVGARGEIPEEWSKHDYLLSVIGFEPDKEECRVLNNNHDHKSWIFLPYALGDRKKTATYFITKFPDSSGLIKGDQLFLDRLDPIHGQNLEVIAKKEINLVSLSEALSSLDIDKIGPFFLKIDVEGAENLVLNGASDLFEKALVLGVKTEVTIAPIRGKGIMHEIDSFMHRNNFYLFDLHVDRYARSPFHRGKKVWGETSVNKYLQFVQSDFGQVAMADFLYLRDPVYEHKTDEKSNFNWDDSTVVLKMALIYYTYGLFDCAIELINYYNDNFSAKLPVDIIINSLMPFQRNGLRLRYDEYISISNEISIAR